MLSKRTTSKKETTMRIESEIIKCLKNEIHELVPVEGLKFKIAKSSYSNISKGPDVIIHASFKGERFKFVGEIMSQKSLSAFREKLLNLKSYINQEQDIIPVLVARFLGPAKREECKESGVNFIDLSGNVFIVHEGLYIERIGFPNLFPEERKGRRPFSDKASLMLRVLLSNKLSPPDRDKAWGVRELSNFVNLDPGFVSRMARELEDRNYIIRLNSKIKLRKKKEILEDWVHDYNFRKNKEYKYFCKAKNPEEIIEKIRKLDIQESFNYAFSVHAGANLISPYSVFNQVHFYLKEEDDIDFFEKKLKLRKVDKGENLIILMPFYKNSVFFDKQEVNGLWVVSDIQLYLDLYNYPVRGLEQAQHIYEKRLKQIFESFMPDDSEL